jgi:hypothetical protein
MFEERITRRDVLKKASYITPVILTFLAAPSFASGGSGRDGRDERDERDGRDEGDERDKRGGGNGKKGRRWLWDYERDERHKRKRHWWNLAHRDSVKQSYPS